MDIDGPGLIGAVERELAEGERDGRAVRVITARRTFDTTPEDLWQAITDPDRIPRWFLPVTGELHLGGRYQLEGNASGEVIGCEPPHRLEVTWEFGESLTWLQVTLTQNATWHTDLVLEHTVPVDGHWDEFGPGAVGVGWDLTLVGLGLHLADGHAVDPVQFGQWSASREGARFQAASSEGWCQAALAAGTPGGIARQWADHTTAAYLGDPPPTES
jgi:uncharacterized protein YndB with AHSA1/START domain